MGKSVDFEECRLEVENKPLSVCLSDDSDDSDQRKFFELPRRKVVRPPTSSFKKKLGNSRKNCCFQTGLCCKVCFATIIPIFVVTFIVAIVICFAVLMVGVAGIKAELDGVKIRLSNAEDAEKDFNAKRDELRKDFQEKLSTLKSHEQKVKAFESTIDLLSKQITSLNNSLTDLRNHPSLNVESIKQDLDKLKNGMADSGSNILKVEGDHKTMETTVKKLQTDFHKIEDQLYNATVKISLLEHKPPPERLTTPRTLVVTLTPDEDAPIKRKELDEALVTLRGEQQEICREETSHFLMEIKKLRNQTSTMNFTHLERISSLENEIESGRTSEQDESEEKNRSDISPSVSTPATASTRPDASMTGASHVTTSATSSTAHAQSNRNGKNGVDDTNHASASDFSTISDESLKNKFLRAIHRKRRRIT